MHKHSLALFFTLIQTGSWSESCSIPRSRTSCCSQQSCLPPSSYRALLHSTRSRPAVHPGSQAQKATMPAVHAVPSPTCIMTARSADPRPSVHHVLVERGPITESHVRYPIFSTSSVYSLVPLRHSKHLFDQLFVILSLF